ncbi:hypothetical protein M422DRAFT_65849 [Sphaerobolus stellatus SS14]|nr:hypothetical protein M422DRAFT_65849 [Sphaerobolus stellatus SS14]
MGVPLPRPNPFDILTVPIEHDAYEKCLDLELRHEQIATTHHLTPLICARLLGYMVIEAPSVAGRWVISTEIIRSIGDEEMLDMAVLYNIHFIRCSIRNVPQVRSTKGKTPTPSHHPSAPSFDNQSDNLLSQLPQTLDSYSKAKRDALIRDGYRCIITGKLDHISVKGGDVAYQDGLLVTITHASHIIDQSATQNLTEFHKCEYAASVHAILERFGQLDTVGELNGTGAHRLQNILTLDVAVHQYFDDLELWLDREPNDPIHCYRPAATADYLLLEIPTIIHFQSRRADLPLPDPCYLALHAACAKIQHLSGAAEYLSKVFNDIADLKVLAKDGGSADVLYHAIIRRNDIGMVRV